MRFLMSCLLINSLGIGAMAQEQPNTILVLDGSGSMWGQFDEAPKITVAQQVITDLLADVPDDQGLGLTVYGHRERGDCADIETIVAPAAGTADDIVRAVNGVIPLGNSPMTDAVIAAAQAMRYTQESSTVILMADGADSCTPDPCAAARQLAQNGANFTAHVIGFGVSDQTALEQMQCIADETGGQFINANTGPELALAITTMLEPVIVSGVFEARTDSATGPLVDTPITWAITGNTGAIAENAGSNPFTTDLPQGSFTASAFRIIDQARTATTFEVSGNTDIAVTVIFPSVATVMAPETAVAGSTIAVDWTGPANENDQIITTTPGQTRTLTFVGTDAGSPAALRMPPTAGTYDIHYLMWNSTNGVLASTSIAVTPAIAALSAPDAGIIGTQISIAWSGPDYQGDIITLGQIGGTDIISQQLTSTGSPVTLTLPNSPGPYEVRYQMQQDSTIIARKTIEVHPIPVSLAAPEMATVGETIAIDWTGPDDDGDFIMVNAPGDSTSINVTPSSDGTPLMLQMPTTPGDYDISYTRGQTNDVLFSQAITVTPAQITLTAPETATVGETVSLTWDGPDYPGDFISIGSVGDSSYDSAANTDTGNPLMLQMPAAPGDYEIRYHLGQDNQIIHRHPIRVLAWVAQLVAPDTISIGDALLVGWEGPGNAGDIIGIARATETGYLHSADTNSGNPVALPLPSIPGDYELRYVLGQDNSVIGTRPITVTRP